MNKNGFADDWKELQIAEVASSNCRPVSRRAPRSPLVHRAIARLHVRKALAIFAIGYTSIIACMYNVDHITSAALCR
jgi:hypothetical protein